MDRKPQVGDVYDVRMKVVAIGADFREAVIDLGPRGLSRPYRLTELRRAEPA